MTAETFKKVIQENQHYIAGGVWALFVMISVKLPLWIQFIALFLGGCAMYARGFFLRKNK